MQTPGKLSLKLPTTELVFDKEAGARLGVFLTNGNHGAVVVHHIAEDSPANGKLDVGDVVEAVDDIVVEDPHQGSALIMQAGPSITLRVCTMAEGSPTDVALLPTPTPLTKGNSAPKSPKSPKSPSSRPGSGWLPWGGRGGGFNRLGDDDE